MLPGFYTLKYREQAFSRYAVYQRTVGSQALLQEYVFLGFKKTEANLLERKPTENRSFGLRVYFKI